MKVRRIEWAGRKENQNLGGPPLEGINKKHNSNF